MVHASGTVSLQLDKPYYIAGETIFGKALLTVTQPIVAHCLKVKWKGYERTSIPYQVVEGTEETAHYVTKFEKHSKDFFSQTIELHHFDGARVDPGTYEYPFSYTLDPSLPGVFFYNRHCPEGKVVAAIMYKVKVEVDMDGKDIKNKQRICINSLSIKEPKPIHVENEKGFLLTKGKLKMSAKLEKDIWATHDRVLANVHINNGTSKKVAKLKIKLMQVLTLKAQGRWLQEEIEVLRAEYEGVAKKSEAQRELVLQLDANKVFPTTSSDLISCQYHFDIECDVKLAIDLEVHPNITLICLPSGNGFNLFNAYNRELWA
jgi:hypothetical protein